jgi:Domain of unknown function (DUF4386)
MGKEEVTVDSIRKNAIIVGVLYIVATVAGVLSVAPSSSLLSGSDMLAKIAAHEGQLVFAISMVFIMSVAVAGVAFMIYPLLKQDSKTLNQKGLAVWYLGTRLTEGSLFLVGILAMLALLSLSREFVSAGSPEASHLQSSAVVWMDASNFAAMLGQSVFCIGAAMLYWLLYQSKRIPRWLSVWGFIAAPLMLAAGFLVLIDGDPNSTVSTVLYAPMAVQEMVLALWLIFKGYSPSAMASK